ncbi:hypothetical protein REMIM1_PF00398 (plasmid) [Rhizobium etli bv. mimosae str. Mim1]|nr:hypothetical protein REMIM1_PF00398 [Rhizobium etli bv. mimosae str. Mim1]
MTLDTLNIKIAVSKVSRLYRFHIVARLKGLVARIGRAPTGTAGRKLSRQRSE